MNTSEPGTRFSGGAPGKSAGSSGRGLDVPLAEPASRAQLQVLALGIEQPNRAPFCPQFVGDDLDDGLEDRVEIE